MSCHFFFRIIDKQKKNIHHSIIYQHEVPLHHSHHLNRSHLPQLTPLFCVPSEAPVSSSQLRRVHGYPPPRSHHRCHCHHHCHCHLLYLHSSSPRTKWVHHPTQHRRDEPCTLEELKRHEF